MIKPVSPTTICTPISAGWYQIGWVETSSLFPSGHTNYDPFVLRVHPNMVPNFTNYPLYYHGDETKNNVTLTSYLPTNSTWYLEGNLTPGYHEYSIIYDNEC